jgi:RNA polymerase sigma-70 factor, ECF subfamily
MPDHDAFATERYSRHGGPLMHLATHLTGGDWHRADDLVQETILRAWLHRDAILPGQERAWLAVTARNLAIDGYRRKQARQAREARYAYLTVPTDDLAGRVVDTVTVSAALPPDRRAVIAEVYYAGRMIREAATALGIPPGTAAARPAAPGELAPAATAGPEFWP